MVIWVQEPDAMLNKKGQAQELFLRVVAERYSCETLVAMLFVLSKHPNDVIAIY